MVLPRLSYQPKDRGDEADSKTNSHTPSNSSAPTGGDCDSSIDKPQRSQVLEEEVSRSEEGHALVHMLRDGTPNSNQVPIGGPCTPWINLRVEYLYQVWEYAEGWAVIWVAVFAPFAYLLLLMDL